MFAKDNFTKEKSQKIKRVKDKIKLKGSQNSARISNMLKNARFAFSKEAIKVFECCLEGDPIIFLYYNRTLSTLKAK